jgi:hypothetical protein
LGKYITPFLLTCIYIHTALYTGPSRETVKMLYRGMRTLKEARRAFEGQENAFVEAVRVM